MIFRKLLALLCLALLTATVSRAAPITFDLTYSGSSYGNKEAVATGWITFADFGLPNPGAYEDGTIPDWVTGLSLTVSGTSSGNGTFGLADFGVLFWDTGYIVNATPALKRPGLLFHQVPKHATLDLTKELIGQTSSGSSLAWGTTGEGGGGFLLVAKSGTSAPTGIDNELFSLMTGNGTGDALLLTSMRPSAIPEPSTYAAIIGAAVLGIAVLRRRFRR